MDGKAIKQMEDEAADARLQRFCDLLGLIERMDDGDYKLAQAEAILKVLAGWQVVDIQLEKPEEAEEAPKTEDVSERLDSLCNLMMRIEDGPDGGEKLDYIKTFALGLLPTNGKLDGYSVKESAQMLAGAIATIEQVHERGHMPEATYRAVMDELRNWISEAEWENNSELSRQILPLLLKQVITQM